MKQRQIVRPSQECFEIFSLRGRAEADLSFLAHHFATDRNVQNMHTMPTHFQRIGKPEPILAGSKEEEP